MSINHILKDVVPDDEKLDVQFKDIYCDNIFSTNPPVPPVGEVGYLRKYQQFTPVSISLDAPISIFNTESSIGSYLLGDYNVGTRYEFTVTGNYLTSAPNKDLTIAVNIGSLVAINTTMTIPTTIGGHTLTCYLLTEKLGLSGVGKLSGSLTHTFNSSSGSTTSYTTNFTNVDNYSTAFSSFLGVTANWGDTDPHSISFRDFKLDRVG